LTSGSRPAGPAPAGEVGIGVGGGVDEVLAALADPTRRLLLDRLSAHGEATATVLAAELPVSRQAVVQHLAVLDRVGLVTVRRHGREQRYAVRPARLIETARWMDRVAARWDARLAAVKRIAEAES
jgi:DNA-binding transcriptional ArsR family regulator